MYLGGIWDRLETIAQNRLAHNKTVRHVSRYGEEIETLGVAGELAARRFLGLPVNLHEFFDGGVDLVWRGWKVDVKATRLTPRLRYRYLQWPEGKPFNTDIVLLTAVDLKLKEATIVGWAWWHEVQKAPINRTRAYPCHEIPIPELRPLWELVTINEKETT